MATKGQIFEWIYEPCALPFTDAMQVAEVVATKLAEENGSSYNIASDEICACAGIETSNMHPKSIIKSWRYCPYCGRKLSHLA